MNNARLPMRSALLPHAPIRFPSSRRGKRLPSLDPPRPFPEAEPHPHFPDSWPRPGFPELANARVDGPGPAWIWANE